MDLPARLSVLATRPLRQLSAVRPLSALVAAASLAGACGFGGPPPTLPPLVTLAPIPTPAPRVEPSRSRAVPASIDATGEVDVSVDLQAFVDRVPDGTRIAFPEEGTFLLDERGLHLDGRRGLVFEGNGSTLRTTGCSSEGSAFKIGGGAPSTRIVIRDLAIVGANDRAGTSDAFVGGCEHAHGVSIHRSTAIEIDDVTFSGLYGDCVYVGGGGFGPSKDVSIHDSVCSLNGRQGVAITNGEGVRIERVRFDGIGLHAFDIEPNRATDTVRDVIFVDNEVGSYGVSPAFTSYFFAANGDLDALVDGVTIANNVVTGKPVSALVGGEFLGWDGGRTRNGITFVGNRSDTPARGPTLTFKHVDGLQVYGNVQPLDGGELVATDDVVGLSLEPPA
jgi:hypothetical protein